MMAILAKELYYGGDPERATQVSEDALSLARVRGDPTELAHVTAFTTAFSRVTPLERHGTLVRELVTLSEAVSDPELRFQAANASFIHATSADRRDELDAAVQVMLRLADAIGKPIVRIAGTASSRGHSTSTVST